MNSQFKQGDEVYVYRRVLSREESEGVGGFQSTQPDGSGWCFGGEPTKERFLVRKTKLKIHSDHGYYYTVGDAGRKDGGWSMLECQLRHWKAKRTILLLNRG